MVSGADGNEPVPQPKTVKAKTKINLSIAVQKTVDWSFHANRGLV